MSPVRLRSVNLGGAGITNVDLVLGQGRVAGQAILKDVGKAMLDRGYAALASQQKPQAGAPQSLPMSMGAMAALGILLIGCAAFGYEIGRRRNKTS